MIYINSNLALNEPRTIGLSLCSLCNDRFRTLRVTVPRLDGTGEWKTHEMDELERYALRRITLNQSQCFATTTR